jgi:hypothetical protein
MPISNYNVLIIINQFFNRLINKLAVQKKHTLTRKQEVVYYKINNKYDTWICDTRTC